MEEERKIEKWLRAYAKKRRGQAKDTFDLHPATRRLLQDEIARRAPVPDEDDSVSLWEMLRQQWVWLLVFTACILLIATIFMPVVYQAKEKAQSTLGMAHLKQIGAAVQMSAADNHGHLPASLDELTNGYLAKEDLSGRENDQQIVYTGAGKNLNNIPGNAVLAYSKENKDTRDVLFANGQTELVDRKKFEEVTNTDLSQAVAMNNLAPQPELQSSMGREPANAGGAGGAPPAPAPQPATPMPEASPAEPPPAPPSMAASAPEPNSISQLPPALAAGSMSATPEEPPRPTSASSDLVVNSASAPAPIMTPPPAPAGETAETPATREAFGSPVAETAVQPQLGLAQNTFQNSATSSQDLPVLSNFQVQQNGNALRIVDQDGSVYVGSWRLANQAAHNGIVEERALQNSANQAAAKTPQTSAPPAVALADNVQATQNYIFRVRGMNRTLRQNVIFTGSLLANYALSGNMQQTFGGVVANANGNEQRLKMDLTNQTTQLPWSNLRITGTAVVNRTNRIEVNAAPVIPTKQN